MQIVNFAGESGIPRGDTFKISLVFEVDIEGWTVWFTVKEIGDTSDDDTTAVIQKKQTIAESTMTCNIELTPEDTDIEPETYKYDVQVKHDNVVTTIFTGDFEILPSITRST